MCSEFELREGRRPVLADADRLQHRARELALEASAEVAAEAPGAPPPKPAIPEDVLPTEVSVVRQHSACTPACLPAHHSFTHLCSLYQSATECSWIPCHTKFSQRLGHLLSGVACASIICKHWIATLDGSRSTVFGGRCHG